MSHQFLAHQAGDSVAVAVTDIEPGTHAKGRYQDDDQSIELDGATQSRSDTRSPCCPSERVSPSSSTASRSAGPPPTSAPGSTSTSTM